jgi:hypothetical protein
MHGARCSSARVRRTVKVHPDFRVMDTAVGAAVGVVGTQARHRTERLGWRHAREVVVLREPSRHIGTPWRLLVDGQDSTLPSASQEAYGEYCENPKGNDNGRRYAERCAHRYGPAVHRSAIVATSRTASALATATPTARTVVIRHLWLARRGATAVSARE